MASSRRYPEDRSRRHRQPERDHLRTLLSFGTTPVYLSHLDDDNLRWLTLSDSAGTLETTLFFERNRAHMLVIREGMHDDKFHFTIDSSGVVRIYRHWLRPDSVIRTGGYHGDDTLALWHPAYPDSHVRYVRIAPPDWRR